MSGGHFDYNQYHIRDIADAIERDLSKQGKPLSREEYNYPIEYEKLFTHPVYPEEVRQAMVDAIKALRIAEIYVTRVDWFLSGDDGDESFLKKLQSDLNKLNNEYDHE